MGLTQDWNGKLAHFSTDSSGNTVLVGADGVAKDRFPLPLNPNGLSWLTDTLHGFDIYERGFVKRPTLFFDPTATTSMNRGTFAHPYNTQAALQAAIAGNMAGHVLGLKRGTTLQVTGTNGLNLNCYGSSASPFIICPYGDAEALPVISGHSVVTTWAATADANVWKLTLATESDIWQSGTRVWKLNPTNGATNNATGTTVNSEATAITALNAKGAGWSVYAGGVMYFKPYSNENPNLGQCYIAVANNALLLQYTDWAGASGYVTFAGIDTQYSRGTAFAVEAAGLTNITSAGGIIIAGCRAQHAGTDTGSPTANNGFKVYGPSDTVRLSSIHIVGNYANDVLNNAYEVAGIDGTASRNAIVEHNTAYNVGGNLWLEMWASCSNIDLRYNYGKNASTFGRMYTSFSAGAAWIANNYGTTFGVWNTNDATNAKNVNNYTYFNLAENTAAVCFDARGGSGHVTVHNTWVLDHDTMFGTTASKSSLPPGLYTSGTAATGFLTWSNNLIYHKAAASVPEGYLNPSFVNLANGTLGAANSVPSGDKNIYFMQTGYGTANWRAGGTSNTSFTAWKTAMSAYSLDQNSMCALGAANAYGSVGGTLTVASLGFDATTFKPIASAAQGVTTLTGIGTRYRQGTPYSAATPTIGCSLGS